MANDVTRVRSNPVELAAGAKGLTALAHRVGMIARRYGPTPVKMERALAQFAETLQGFDCSATFPATAVAIERHPDILAQYQAQGIEFAVHGYRHIDYSQLEPEEQLASLYHARQVFARAGLEATGFRSPYLRREAHLNTAIKQAGFSYVSNQPIMWDVLDASAFTDSTYANYQRALAFYDPWHAAERPSLPRIVDGLVEIPVCLPDDEILLDRLGGQANGLVEKTWRRMLSRSYGLGELCTLQLHPERIVPCVDGLSAVLAEARACTPPIWLARMDEIAAWWRARADTSIKAELEEGVWRLSVAGPPGTTILLRNASAVEATQPWADGYHQAIPTTANGEQVVTLVSRTGTRPFVGVSPACPPSLTSFLRSYGYVLQLDEDDGGYSTYVERSSFDAEEERALLSEIETGAGPLVRVGHWPDGARSALCVTGDIDALTLWDYGARFVGR